MRAPAARWAPYALAGIVVVGALLLWTQARQIHLWTQDEEYFVQLSRLLTEHFPGGVVDLPVQPFDERGIQRLTILLLAVPLGIITGETGVELGRLLMCLAFASAAIPAYLLARGARLTTGWALATAALTVFVPWSVLTGSFLSESVAYPAALWAIWGAWRACVVPGVRSDLLALALVLAAGLARTNLLVLIVVAPIAVTLHTLASVGLRRLPGQMWRDHPLYSVLIVPGAIISVLTLVGAPLGPLSGLAGGYVVSLDVLDFGPVPEKWALQVSRMVTGMAILPVLVGMPWMLRQALRRTGPELGALALTGLVGFFVVLFSTVYAAAEERYLMLAAPFVLVPGIVAIARREASAWAIAVWGVLLGLLLWRVPWPFVDDLAFFLTDPSATFVGRAIMSHLPGEDLTFGLLALAAGLVAAVLVGRGRGPVWGPVALVAAVVAVQLVQVGYVHTKRVDIAGGPGDLPDWTWVDDRVGDEKVAIHATGMANSNIYGETWRDVTFYNRRVDRLVTREFLTLQVPRYAEGVPVEVADDGRMVTEGDLPIPRYLLEPTLFRREGVLAESVAVSTYLPVELVRLRGEPRVTYRWSGAEVDGWLTPEEDTAELRLFPPALEVADRPCLRLTVAAPAVDGTRTRWTVRTGERERRGTLGPDERATVQLPLRTGRERVELEADGGAPVEVDGRRLALAIADTAITGCR